MSIAALNQVYDEMRRLAIAGSNLASDDFRLKKLLPPLEQAGAKTPVFAKVAQAIQRVVDPANKAPSEALVELSTLVTAILYTQGETGVKGTMRDIATQDFQLPTTTTSARVIKPLIEALTTTGSGRLEIIRDAHERGAFKDLRLVKLAVGALDDVYAEIADFVADHVLPTFGRAIYQDLHDGLDLKGKGSHVRRLRLMHQLDAETTRPLVEQALECGSAEMKVAALGCLKGSKDHLSYLLEQTAARSKEVRRAAFDGIGEVSDASVVEALTKALSSADIDLVVGPVSRNRSPKLLTFLLDDGQRQLDELFATKAKAKLKTQLSRFHAFLECFETRADKKSAAFLLQVFERRDELGKLTGSVSGQDIVQRVATLLVANNSKAGQKLLVQGHSTSDPQLLAVAMLAAIRTTTPKAVFKEFSPYYATAVSKKRGRDSTREKREVIRGVVHTIAQSYKRHYVSMPGSFGLLRHEIDVGDWLGDAKLDPGWLDVAVQQKDLETVLMLARPRHKAAMDFLKSTIDASLAKKTVDLDYEFSMVLDTMNRINHPATVDSYMTALEKVGKSKGNRYYYAYWLVRLIPDLPKSAAAEIEALLPSLHEKVIDEVIPYLEQLKAK